MDSNHAGRRQGGITFIGFVVVLGLLGLFAYLGMKLVPMYTEYYSVKQALKGLKEQPDIANTDPGKVKDLFFRRLYISYAENVKNEDFKIERIDTGGWRVTVAYELRKPLIANLDVVGRFNATEDLTKSGPAD